MLPLLKLADRFAPAGMTDPLRVQRQRAAVVQSWIGVMFTALFGGLYFVMGSPWSGAAILLITAGLLVTPPALRRGYSRIQIGNGLIAMTWLATFVVAVRSGGFSSPSLVWSFLLPLCTYSACNQQSAVTWSVLSGLQVAGFYVADVAGVHFAQDFSPSLLSILRISGYLGVILAVVAVLLVVESARLAAAEGLSRSNRALERERLLADMHDGIGSQLLGLVVQARIGTLEQPRLLLELETCIDDLRLIVGSRDAEESSLEQCLADLRARMVPRCEALGMELDWTVTVAQSPAWTPEVVLQLLRCAQEMLTNAVRHGRAQKLELLLFDCEDGTDHVELAVQDNGCGLPPDGPPHIGRGLSSLRARARRLGGRFQLVGTAPGARASLRFPRPTCAPL